MNRFRVAFATLLFFAVATTALAGWGLIGTSALQSSSFGPAISASSSSSLPQLSPNSGNSSQTYGNVNTSSSSAISSSTTSVSSTESSTSSNTVSSAVTTATTTTVTTSAVAATTTTSGGMAFVAGNGIASTTTNQNQGALASLSTLGPTTESESLLRQVQAGSLLLAPVTWVLLGGMWVWRGRVRARYSEMGFGSDVFELFMKMKGGATRIKVLNTLSTPKDRLQLAQELGVDWKTVDRHVQILNKYGFVREQAAFGTVRLYEVTPMGKMLLDLFDDLEKTDGPVVQQRPPKSLES